MYYVNTVNVMFGATNAAKLFVNYQMMTILFALTVSQASFKTL